MDWITLKGAWLFDGISTAVTYALINIEAVLKWMPWPAVVAGLALLSFAVGRWGLTAFAALALLFVGFMDLWENMMDTVALMVVAVVIAVTVGLPLGILAARNRTADYLLRPILDGMQTMPSFVYLLPGILFFGLGKPAGIFATIIYAVPPVIRLTNLGIRQVSAETVEASRSFGASPWQLLTTVQIPMALPTIMAGINQTTMMALAMVTIASMVAAGGLGDDVLRALQKNQSGNGAIAGLAIVFLAIIIDRLTQSVAARRQDKMSVGLAARLSSAALAATGTLPCLPNSRLAILAPARKRRDSNAHGQRQRSTKQSSVWRCTRSSSPRSKMFCACPAEYVQGAPNTVVCPVSVSRCQVCCP